MLSHLLNQMFRSIGVFFRTFRAFFTRKLAGLVTYVRRFTNFSRHATKAAAASLQGAAAAIKKPSRREDYIETQRLLISKSFLILLLLGLIGLGMLAYFFLWPFVLSRFLTARFYCEDERVPEWTGRVIVYRDQDKRVPMYSGVLTQGVLQGQGKAYDEAGLLIYEGSFADGLYSGSGRSYAQGVLVYDGQFQEGLYQGTGALYQDGELIYQGGFSAGEYGGLGAVYENGEKRFEGAFVSGLLDGEGTEYAPGGTPLYKGTFSSGVREGMGTLYDGRGNRSYAGAFAEGLREGEGTEYRPDGRIGYKGGFVQDRYEGQGSLYLENGDRVDAEFTAGETAGTIRWYRSGALWYEGGAEGLTPDGYGTIYGEDGKVLYAGALDRGTIDGAWLLGLSAGEVREAFGEAALTEAGQGDGFWIENAALGLWVLSSFQSEESPAQVRQVLFQPGEGAAVLLPWDSRGELDAWAQAGGGSPLDGTMSLSSPAGTEGERQAVYRYEDGVFCVGLYPQGQEALSALCWAKGGDPILPPGSGEEGVIAQAQERLEELAGALEAMGGGSGGSVEQGDVERMLALMFTAQEAQELLDALSDCLLYGQVLEALETERPLLERQVAEAQTALERGSGSELALENAREALDGLSRRQAQYEKGRKEAEEKVLELSGLAPSDYDLRPVLVSFDPVELDASALYASALTYAKEVAAKRYEVDTKDLETQLRETVLELSMSYETIRAQRRNVEQLIARLEEQTEAYAKAAAGREDLYSAQCALCEGLVALYEETGRFQSLANRLNTQSGGWLSRTCGWLDAPLSAVFQGEIVRGQEEAARLERERQEREEEAARALEEAREAARETQTPQETPPAETQAPQETPPAETQPPQESAGPEEGG